jgi:putative ABC transport system substrate-binding protein
MAVKVPAISVAALALSLLAAPLAVAGQAEGKVYRIGFLGSATASGYANQIAALREGLRDLGYDEGKNIVIEYRWAEGRYDRLPVLAAELVALKVDLIVTHALPGSLAAKQATTTIPIVMAAAGDPVASGIVPSLARPGGNITGSSFFVAELAAKRLEMLKEAVPHIRRVAVLLNPDNPVNRPILNEMELAAKSLKVGLQQFGARGPDHFENAFSAMVGQRTNGLVVHDDPMLIANARQIADLAATKRLPSIGFKEFAVAGSLMAYAVDFPAFYRRAAVFVDKILKGAKPGDLPIERATRFEVVINLKTAKALGFKIPPSVLVRATEVIE